MKNKKTFMTIILAIIGLSNVATARNINIPDSNFKARLVANTAINTNGDGEIQGSEAANFSGIMDVNSLNNGMKISDLTGINAFTALTGLNCSYNQLTSLNLSANTVLETLNCAFNQLTILIPPSTTTLANLNCKANKLNFLNVTANPALKTLNCWYNQLFSLDVSANTALTYLNCSANTYIPNLNVSVNTALTHLECGSNQLTSLDLSTNTALTYLSCGGNHITSLNVSANTALTHLQCSTNPLSSLNITANTALTHLECFHNQLTSLDLSTNTALTYLGCGGNHITSLSVSTNTALTDLECGDNQLTNLNVSTNTALIILYCYSNPLTDLNVSVNTALTTLYCHANQLTSLDISANTTLTILSCSSNQLTSLNVKNGNNTNFIDFNATNNSNLNCIQVDNAAYSNSNWTSSKDAIASFSVSCNCTLPQAPSTTNATICINNTASLSAIGVGTLGWYNQAIGGNYLGGGASYTTPILNTSTTFYVQDSTCAASATRKAVLVTVNPLPTITATASANNVCEGASVTLTGGGASSYTWSGGVTNGVGFIPTTTTTYTVTGTDGNNCSNTATKTIHVNPLPTVSANASATIVCAGTSITLSGDGATSYTWSGGVTNGLDFAPVTTATYTVTGTDGNNCSNTATKTIHVNPLPTVTAIASATNVCEGTIVTLTGGGAASYSWSGGITNGVAFIASTSTTYTVTGTDVNNCSNTATKTIHVNPLPTVTAIASATNVCEGISVTLTGGGAISYSWSGGVTNGIGFIPTTTTTYNVTGTDGNNCSNTATKTIIVNHPPDVSTDLNGLTISANQIGAIYQWLNCNNGNSAIAGATDQSFTASINGNYAVIVKMNGCSDTSSCVNVSITGIEKIAEKNIQLKVFPNPGNGSITVTLSGVEGQSINEMIYTIKNESGQTIQSFKLNTSNNYTINIENLSNGIYFIVGLNGNQMINQKVVVAK